LLNDSVHSVCTVASLIFVEVDVQTREIKQQLLHSLIGICRPQVRKMNRGLRSMFPPHKLARRPCWYRKWESTSLEDICSAWHSYRVSAT